MNRREYQKIVRESSPKTKEAKTLITAFIVGGLICCIGEAIGLFFERVAGVTDQKTLGTCVSSTLITLAAIFTGLGWYDRLGAHAGAGSIVPITGFSNSIVSPAMEYNREGIVYGVMSKMFVIAGPVIVSGIVMCILIGLVTLVVGK